MPYKLSKIFLKEAANSTPSLRSKHYIVTSYCLRTEPTTVHKSTRAINNQGKKVLRKGSYKKYYKIAALPRFFSPVTRGLCLFAAYNRKTYKSRWICKSPTGQFYVIPAVTGISHPAKLSVNITQQGCILPIQRVLPSELISNIIDNKTGKPKFVTAPGTGAKFYLTPLRTHYKLVLPSKRTILIPHTTLVQVGRNKNTFIRQTSYGSAGMAKRCGNRQHVRQKAMNAHAQHKSRLTKKKLPWYT